MANEPKSTSSKADDLQKALEEQIYELREEIARINETVAERSAGMISSARDKASEAYVGAADRAARATRQLRTQANAVSEVARENPATTTAVLGAVGLIGFMLGMVVGQSTTDTHHRRWHM
ncbi:hypothetical protein EET67_23890 [Pseudaminobacter arsenicus]|uniref:DUF883 family protein n=1 Tax=Borborobacter arsenicus TaxID=1851146 RepID=A0A432UZU7_9HYPH|nr:hypothetical protein [Pseudaminobacter arsenicus]RUM95322.1 hypothetical protein EET67_23890 [Pseudaminobacter arsenicus]